MRYMATEYFKLAVFFDPGSARPLLPGQLVEAWGTGGQFQKHLLKHVGTSVSPDVHMDDLASHYALREHLLAGAGEHLRTLPPANMLAIRPQVPPDIGSRLRQLAGPAQITPYRNHGIAAQAPHPAINVDYPELRHRHGVIQAPGTWPSTLSVYPTNVGTATAKLPPVSPDQLARRRDLTAFIQQLRGDPSAVASLGLHTGQLDALDALHAAAAAKAQVPVAAPAGPRGFAPLVNRRR
jgi:hypothetical protein